MFENFIKSLKTELTKPLPGREAQFLMAPSIRLNNMFPESTEEPTRSSVLILLYKNATDISVVFIKRQTNGRIHGGQIALPGGHYETFDSDYFATALRETYEEVGIEQSYVHVLGALTELYIPASNFIVFPVVGYTAIDPVFVADPNEVEEVIEVQLTELVSFANRKVKQMDIKGISVTAPYFEVGEHHIWGATAMIISEFIEILKRMEMKFLLF
jgi:8-oxo-dGTP pyrophosphatase MutT (NUDIX family)